MHWMKKYLDDILWNITALGGIFSVVVLLIAVGVVQEYSLLKDLVIGTIITILIPSIIRTFYFKDRPKKKSYTNLIERIDASSFPSVHAARSTFLALALANFFNNPKITVFLITLALLVSYSRIYLKKHFLIDVAGGIVVGLLTFWFVGIL